VTPSITTTTTLYISVKDLYHPFTMSTATNSYYFRRRTMGRAASPPTWACYEQIHNDDDYSNSDSDSCSEDDEDYNDGGRGRQEISDSEENDPPAAADVARNDDSHDIEMDMDEDRPDNGQSKDMEVDKQKDIKGKQRAIEPEPESPSPRRQRKKREHVFTLRPILTIQRSQGFVWNQVCCYPLMKWLEFDTIRLLGSVRPSIHQG
jgi:hypothetical protein